jgi:hypothetical protein
VRRLSAAVVLALLGLTAACKEAGTKDLGQAVGDAGSDTALLKEANGAANEVVRNASDCPAARAAIAPAYEKMDAIEKELRTEAGRATLGALRKQVDRISELCPQ